MEQTGMPNVCSTGSTADKSFDIVSDMKATQDATGSRDIAIDTNHITLNQPFKRNPDEYLPIPNVIKIMRQVLPPHVKILDESKEIIRECVSEFIAFVTKAANENCHRDCRKIIKPEDILSAMESTGFGDYIEPLAVFLNKYRSSYNYSDQPTPIYVQPPPASETMNFVYQPQPQPQPAVFRPEPRVIQPTTTFSHATSNMTSTLCQPNADELSQILDYFMSDQSARGEGSCGGSFFDPYNRPMN